MVDIISVAYRDHDRTPLLYVLQDEAARHENLRVDILHVPGAEEYEQGFLRGEFDLICEHIRFLFPARLEGHPVRCIAACENKSVNTLVGMSPIASASELAGKTLAIRDVPSSHILVTYWMKRLGLEGQVRFAVFPDAEVGRWQQWRKVVDGQADAAMCSPLYLEPALAAGVQVLDVPHLPEIGPLFFAGLGPFLESNDAMMQRFMRALYRAVHTFTTDEARSLAIMSGEPARLMGLQDESNVRKQYATLRAQTDGPIPRPEAIEATFAMVNESYADVARLSPLSMWDLRYIAQLEEARFMERLASGATV